MKKRGYVLLAFVAMILIVISLTSCKKHKHNFVDATCTNAKTCLECGKTEGTALGHDWEDATIDHPKRCTRCGTTEGVDLIVATFNLPTTTSGKVDLPKEVNGNPITWKSLDYTVMLDDGVVVASENTQDAVLEASLVVDGIAYKKECHIEVEPIEVDKNVYQTAYKYYSSKINPEVSKNIVLLNSNYNGCTVQYKSFTEDVITSDGVISQKAYDQDATLMIYVIKDGIAISYREDFKVVAYTVAQRTQIASSRIAEIIDQFVNGETSTLPLHFDDLDVDVIYNSNIPEFLVLDDVVLTPLVKTTVRLSVALRCETQNETSVKEHDFILENIGGTMTEEEYISHLVKYITKVELKGSERIPLVF